MNILYGKRFAAVLLAFVAIFSLYVLLEPIRNYIWIVALLLIGLFAATFFFQKPRSITAKKAVLSVLMALSVCGAILSGAVFVGKTEKTAKSYIGTEHTASAYVTDIHYEEPYGASYSVVLTEIDGEKVKIGAILELPYAAALLPYDTVTFDGSYLALDEEFAVYRQSDGIWLTVSAQDVKKIGETEKPFDAFFDGIRLMLRQNFQKYFEPAEAGFATALLTGQRDDLDGDVRLAFTRTGISHLLAVSGLHLAIIVGGADAFLRILTVPKKKKNAILILLTAFFACICGLSASILRAASMLSLYYLTDIFGETNDSLTSLSFSAFIILLLHPRSVYDVGFWLSCLSTFGILVLMPVLHFRFLSKVPRILRNPIRFVLSSLFMTLAATFFTLPVVYLTFGGISLISPIANLIFIPLTQMILYLLLIFTFVSWIPFLASFLAALAQWMIAFTVSLAKTVSDIKGIYISLRYPFAIYILIALILCALTVLFLKKARPVLLFAVFFACTLAFSAAYGIYRGIHHDAAYLYLRSDGKSDVIGIISDGDTVLIDVTTGGAAMPVAAYKDLSDFYVCEIDAYLLTHYHSYHPNTLRKLSENIKIHRLLLPEPLTENDRKYSGQIHAALDGKIKIEYYQTGELPIGNAVISLPERGFLHRSEHPVITFSASLTGNGQTFAYLSSSATEIATPTEAVVICGCHGPVEKHIFDPALLQRAHFLVFADRDTAVLTELDRIPAEIFYAEDYGGYFRILFDSGN